MDHQTAPLRAANHWAAIWRYSSVVEPSGPTGVHVSGCASTPDVHWATDLGQTLPDAGNFTAVDVGLKVAVALLLRRRGRRGQRRRGRRYGSDDGGDGGDGGPRLAPRGVARATPLGAQCAERRLKPPHLRAALMVPASTWGWAALAALACRNSIAALTCSRFSSIE